MIIRTIKDSISIDELKSLAAETYKDMTKAVVDIDKQILAIGGELHADAESQLLDQGSKQENLWGINLYVNKPDAERIEFTSFINIRPKHGNMAIEVEDPALRDKISKVVNQRVVWS